MPIDYSKWDKLELSDDSDIEVHPNVDKNSFIKWKQRDIHEKRLQRNQEIKTILVQLTMYAKLNERVDHLLKTLKIAELLDDKLITSTINEKFDKDEKFDYEALLKGENLRKGLKDLEFNKDEFEDTPPYNEMVEDLFTQIKEDHPEAEKDASKLVDYVKEHRAKIDDILSKQAIKLDELLYQKSLLISSEDYHTGFDSSFLNKDDTNEPVPKPSAKSTESVTTVETLNEPDTPKTDREMLEDLQVLPETVEFSAISKDDFTKIAEYLVKHPWICTEQQKDALIMTAFDHQLAGDSKAARQVIHQSLLLQYIAQLAGGNHKYDRDATVKAIKLFMGKMNDTSVPVKSGFLQDYENTFNHIKTRCEIIQQEHEQQDEGEALIQLRALDDDTQLSVNIPEEGTPEYKIFTEKLPIEMQQAVRTGSLDEVNKVFATYKIEEAEKLLETVNECGVIGVTGYLEDENEFTELQKQYNEQAISDQPIDEAEEIEEKQINTEDIVD